MNHTTSTRRKRIWIDLDNSPHVPFFTPIIRELDQRGYALSISGRDCFQVRELAALAGLSCKIVGHHWGRRKVMKIIGTCVRAVQLTLFALTEKPDLAVSHGSRSQLLACGILRTQTLMIDDYECSERGIDPDWLVVPEVIPTGALSMDEQRILKYPGIKEDVYVPSFEPDIQIRETLKLNEADIVVTVRPPASEAHYRNPESELLYLELMDCLRRRNDIKVILLPRSTQQAEFARREWKDKFDTGRFVIPDHALDGLNLIWHSDVVVSGGGTMNREAAALGVPVYSIFRGPLGAVDRHLVAEGRLILLGSAEEVRNKIVWARREKMCEPAGRDSAALQSIVNTIVSVAEATPTTLRTSSSV